MKRYEMNRRRKRKRKPEHKRILVSYQLESGRDVLDEEVGSEEAPRGRLEGLGDGHLQLRHKHAQRITAREIRAKQQDTHGITNEQYRQTK
jgi:hypothetical protein